jgi:hypothetical protein
MSGSITTLEISKSPLEFDSLKVLGTLTCGGTLVVTNLTPGMLEAGDSFEVLDAAIISGAFSGVQLPPLTGSLLWNTNNLLVDGTLTVVAPGPPVIQSISRMPDGNVQLEFSGTPGAPYEVRASTNVTLAPLTSWSLIASGILTGSTTTLNDLAATNYPQRFYVIRLP